MVFYLLEANSAGTLIMHRMLFVIIYNKFCVQLLNVLPAGNLIFSNLQRKWSLVKKLIRIRIDLYRHHSHTGMWVYNLKQDFEKLKVALNQPFFYCGIVLQDPRRQTTTV